MSMKKASVAAICSMGLATAFSFDAAAQTKVGFVYVGPVSDYGWTYRHDVGRLAVEEAFGDDVETTYIEDVPESQADVERVMTQLALSGHDLIFTTSFGYMDPTINVAKRFPNIKFEHATGYKRAENVSTYSPRFYEGRAVIGHIAGRMTKSNIVGYIAAYPIPEVIRGINSAYIHAKRVNPDIEFKIVWIFSWFDPAKTAEAATTLIDQGADVLMQHMDSTAPMTIAEEKEGIYAFGQSADMKEFGPTSQLSAIINNWGPYYVERTKAVIDGTWESVNVWYGINEGMIEMGEFLEKIPQEVRDEAQALSDAIAAGEHHPFTGPLNRQDGSAWLAEGEVADDAALLGMDFYVEGIEASIPQ